MRKIFSKFSLDQFEAPNLVQVQLDSYKWFLDVGLKELLKDVSPIEDWTGEELELRFLDYKLEEPKYDERKAMEKNVSFEAPLKIKIGLKNKRTEQQKEQELFLADFPLMTPRGTFIINGVERVVISQLIRSPGTFFSLSRSSRFKRFFGAKLIPSRGAWLEFETEYNGVISVRIDRKRKMPATALLRAFGITGDEQIKKLFEDKGTIVVAHNAPFDLIMIKKEGIEPQKFICTLRVARYLDPEEKIERYNLQYLRYLLEIEVDATAHDALGDVLVLEQLFERLRKKLVENERLGDDEALEKMIEISGHPSLLHTFKFGKHNGKRIEEVMRTDKGYLEWLLEQKLNGDGIDEDWIYTLKHYLRK